MIQGKITRCIQAGILGVAMFALLPSCSDDHFIVQDGGGEGENATLTLWQQIKADPELSNFANIAEKTPAFKDEKHPIKNYTFKDVLNSNQTLTVFAPTNSAFTSDEVHYYDSLVQVRPYDVFLRLVGNHIARNRYAATGTNPNGKPEKVIMVNNKKATFDREAKLFKEIPILKANIPATNGVLHKIGQQSTFAYNVYEFIRANDHTYRKVNDWLEQHDTLYFNSDLSAIAGSNPETGEPIFVDSVYSRYNSLYAHSYSPRSVEWVMPHKGVNANLEAEDSIWAVVLPTDAAWNEAYQKMEKYYTYANTYFDKSKESAFFKDNATAKKALPLTVTDSLKEISFAMDIVSPLAFNVRMQKRIPEQTDFWTIETFEQYQMKKLFDTRTDTFTIDERGTLDVKPLIFDGKAPITVSNGVVFPVDHWNYDKTFGYKDVDIKMSPNAIFQNVRYNLSTQEQRERTYNADYEVTSFNSETSALANDSALGRITKNSFMTFSRSTSVPTAEITLRGNDADQQVLSNLPYDIYIVMVPDFYRVDPDSIMSYMPGETPFKKNKLQVEINYLSEDLKETKTPAMKFDYEGEKVDTILVGEITFPYSYRNLSKCYPTMIIKSQTINAAARREGYQTTFSIDKVILRAKE